MKRVWLLATVIALAFAVNASAISVADINATGGAGANACPAPYTGPGCIKFGDKIFRGITVGGAGSASGVDVTGEQIGDTVFINFTGAFIDTNPPAAPTDYTIAYNVTSLIGASIGGITQSLAGDFHTASGFLNFKEDVFSDAALLNKVANSQIGCVFTPTPDCDNADPAPELIQGDDLIIAPPLSRVWVTKDLLVFASTEGSSLGASIIRQGFVQVPEPGQAALLLGGLLAIGLYFKSRKRAEA